MDLTRFHRDGYLFPIDVLTAERARALACLYERDLTALITANPMLAQVHSSWKSHVLFPWLREIALAPPLLWAITNVLGDDVFVWSTDIFVKPPRDHYETAAVGAKGLAWHQDDVYVGIEPSDRMVRAWVALTETTLENGTMRYLPGTHKTTYRHVDLSGTRDNGHGPVAVLDVDESRAVPVCLRPGQCSLHRMSIVHDSGTNSTGTRRICVAITYVAGDAQVKGLRDSAWLVHGRDTGVFNPEVPEGTGMTQDCIEHFLRSVGSRYNRLSALHGSAWQ